MSNNEFVCEDVRYVVMSVASRNVHPMDNIDHTEDCSVFGTIICYDDYYLLRCTLRVQHTPTTVLYRAIVAPRQRTGAYPCATIPMAFLSVPPVALATYTSTFDRR